MTQQHAARRRLERGALLALFAGACAIGVVPVLVRMSPTGPVMTAFWRLALAWPVLYVLHRAQPAAPTLKLEGLSGPRDVPAWMLVLPGLFFAGDLSFWHWSLKLTSVANATLLANCAPVFVTMIAWRYLGERFRVLFLGGLFIALLGVTVLMRHSLDLSRDAFLGDLFGLITAGFYAGYQLSIKRLRARYSTVTVMLWSSMSGTPALLLIAILMRERLFWSAPLVQGWLVLLAMALIGHVSGQGAIAYALAHLPASFSSVALLVQPVIAAGVAWLVLREAVGAEQFLGGAIVLFGIVLARRGSAALAGPP
ncbi:MAG: DMT family transporter [Candidatus Hydrogenedentes bacterium]|nr:DMT family transporter [Candidatus Hydrogenedentota bacterium]